MRRIEPKRELKDYESQGSAIRRIISKENEPEIKVEDEEVEENINILEEKIPSKLMTLLRMGLVEKGELETMKRALKSGEDALTQPVLRKHIYELFNKLVDAVSDDQQIYVRMRKRLQTDNKEEE